MEDRKEVRISEIANVSPEVRFAISRLGQLTPEHFSGQSEQHGAAEEAGEEAGSERDARQAARAIGHLLTTAQAQGVEVTRLEAHQLSRTLGVSLPEVREGMKLLRESNDLSVRQLLPR